MLEENPPLIFWDYIPRLSIIDRTKIKWSRDMCVCVFVHAYSIALPIAEVRRDSGGRAEMADPLFHHRGTLHSLGGIHL